MAQIENRPASHAGEARIPEYLVAALGASAGGIRALKQFFAAVETDARIAYIVILHLSPDHESSLAQVLQSTCPIPVTTVRKRMRIAPDHVYVVSPNTRLTLDDGHIDAADITGAQERRAPIDMFFRTLADAERARAVCVVLSGTGADGSMGLKRVKEYGGLCLAEDPEEADFADMPRNAIATGLVDYVLPVAQIPARLAAYRRNFDAIDLPAGIESGDMDRALVEIFSQVRLRTGHDFSNYKRSTVMRRIERRMNVRDLGSIAEYASYIRENRDEARALLKDLLISVTNFFRDAEAFKALETRVIPRLFEGKGASDHVRVWVAGCATGEEAYSIAMQLAEQAPDPLVGPTVQVFATDIDEAALAKARAGLYTINDAADVSPERLRRFFLQDGDTFRVRRELREMVLFAQHNVIKDPPFSHLDLVACRNLLIYLNRAAQERIVRLFHFGLNAGGYLFLGTSESAEEVANLFATVDKENHLFQSRGVETPLALPPVSAAPVPMPLTEPADLAADDSRMRERMSYQEMHQRLLEQYAAPSVVINQDYDILHLSERSGRYLQFAGGEPSQNLLKVVRPELRLELHGALYHAAQVHGIAEAVAGPVNLDGEVVLVKMTVSPVFSELDPARGMILVLFQNAGEPPARPEWVAEPGRDAEPIARRLDEELVRLRLQLRTTIEQHELQQEELKASNEELQAMNEELRSSTEELETSKEELQSVNEELTTVNQELKIKIDELSHAHNDTRNLMNSTDIATVFVDRAMRIKLFTPQALSVFNMIPGDTGRPLLDITHRLEYPELAHDIAGVLETLAMAEREVRSNEDRWYIARLSPYRTVDDRIAGVVLTFTDITERKRAEEAVREKERHVRLVSESVSDYAIITVDPEGRITSWNTGARQMFGYTDVEAVNQPIEMLFTTEDRAAEVPRREREAAREQEHASHEGWHVRKDGSRFYASGVMAPLMRGSTLVGYTKIARDLTERQRNKLELRAAWEELESRVEERTRELARANGALRQEIAERVQAEESRLGMLRHVVSAQEDERRRIARELHDQLGQEVTSLGLRLSALKAAKELSPRTREEIENLQQTVKALDGDVEFLAWELRPTGLDDLGVGEALSDYVASWSRNFGITAQARCSVAERMPAEVETLLYRIAQEALNNVAKHARASNVEVTLTRNADHVLLEVRDDGKGFDPVDARSQSGLGMVGIRERATLAGGVATIESGRGKGTTVRVRVPLAAPVSTP
jgi:two-component system CheB/CheR fusion protein